MAEAPDVAARIGLADERVVLRDRPVAVDANDLAEVRAEILRRIEAHAVAGRDEQRAVASEDEAVSEVPAADGLRLLPPDHLRIREPVAVEGGPRHGTAHQPVVRAIQEIAKARIAGVGRCGDCCGASSEYER